MDPKEALYFGDARSDYEAAKQNNVDFIGIVNTKSRELKGLRGISKIRDFNSVKIKG
jgi:phosphoglycolate phosphatase-like HAD superfamily hydrolase